MILTLSPIAASTDTAISVDGNTLTYNGTDYDLTTLDPASLTAPFVELSEDSGVYCATIEYFYDTSTAQRDQSDDINDYIIDVTSGNIADVITRT